MTPILEAWAAPDAASWPTIPLLMVDDGQGSTDVADFGVPLGGDVWALASGNDVLDAAEQVIASPTFADVMTTRRHFNPNIDDLPLAA